MQRESDDLRIENKHQEKYGSDVGELYHFQGQKANDSLKAHCMKEKARTGRKSVCRKKPHSIDEWRPDICNLWGKSFQNKHSMSNHMDVKPCVSLETT